MKRDSGTTQTDRHARQQKKKRSSTLCDKRNGTIPNGIYHRDDTGDSWYVSCFPFMDFGYYSVHILPNYTKKHAIEGHANIKVLIGLQALTCDVCAKHRLYERPYFYDLPTRSEKNFSSAIGLKMNVPLEKGDVFPGCTFEQDGDLIRRLLSGKHCDWSWVDSIKIYNDKTLCLHLLEKHFSNCRTARKITLFNVNEGLREKLNVVQKFFSSARSVVLKECWLDNIGLPSFSKSWRSGLRSIKLISTIMDRANVDYREKKGVGAYVSSLSQCTRLEKVYIRGGCILWALEREYTQSGMKGGYKDMVHLVLETILNERCNKTMRKISLTYHDAHLVFLPVTTSGLTRLFKDAEWKEGDEEKRLAPLFPDFYDNNPTRNPVVMPDREHYVFSSDSFKKFERLEGVKVRLDFHYRITTDDLVTKTIHLVPLFSFHERVRGRVLVEGSIFTFDTGSDGHAVSMDYLRSLYIPQDQDRGTFRLKGPVAIQFHGIQGYGTRVDLSPFSSITQLVLDFEDVVYRKIVCHTCLRMVDSVSIAHDDGPTRCEQSPDYGMDIALPPNVERLSLGGVDVSFDNRHRRFLNIDLSACAKNLKNLTLGGCVLFKNTVLLQKEEFSYLDNTGFWQDKKALEEIVLHAKDSLINRGRVTDQDMVEVRVVNEWTRILAYRNVDAKFPKREGQAEDEYTPETLHIESTDLLSAGLIMCDNLEELYMIGTNMLVLPAAIRSLGKLRDVILHNNRLIRLDDEFDNVQTSLERVLLRDNSLPITLGQGLTRLSNPQCLRVKDCLVNSMPFCRAWAKRNATIPYQRRNDKKLDDEFTFFNSSSLFGFSSSRASRTKINYKIFLDDQEVSRYISGDNSYLTVEQALNMEDSTHNIGLAYITRCNDLPLVFKPPTFSDEHPSTHNQVLVSFEHLETNVGSLSKITAESVRNPNSRVTIPDDFFAMLSQDHPVTRLLRAPKVCFCGAICDKDDHSRVVMIRTEQEDGTPSFFCEETPKRMECLICSDKCWDSLIKVCIVLASKHNIKFFDKVCFDESLIKRVTRG